MFSTHERLKKRTPNQGIGRREYIEHLVEEFHTSSNVEAQEQVTANLANFAYDPINWAYLQSSEALDVFLQLLLVPNEKLQLHAVAGLCNICLFPPATTFITTPENFNQLTKLFVKTNNLEIVLNCITLFHQLLNNNFNEHLRPLVASPDILRRISHWKQSTSDLRLSNITTIFLEDFGTRVEEKFESSLTQSQNASASTSVSSSIVQ